LSKILSVLMLFAVSLYSDNLKYIVDAGLFGNLANINLTYNSSKTKYSAIMEIRPKGLVKLRASRILDRRTSRGFIKNGQYYSTLYEVVKTYKGNKKVRRIYSFDYKNKRVTKHYTVWQNGKKITDTKTKLPYFSSNDLLNMYHNIVYYAKNAKRGTYKISAVGAENDGGKIKFSILSKNSIKMYINNSNFSKGKGVLIFDVAASGISDLGKVMRIKMLGSAKLKRIK